MEEELGAIESKRTEIISDADEKAKNIVSQARRAGIEAERVIKEKAKEEAGILLDNAQREINSAQEKAAATLKQESINSAIGLAGKLIQQNLDTEQNRQLTDNLIDKI